MAAIKALAVQGMSLQTCDEAWSCCREHVRQHRIESSKSVLVDVWVICCKRTCTPAESEVMPSPEYIRVQAFTSVPVTQTFVRAERICRFLTLVHVEPNNIALRQTLFW